MAPDEDERAAFDAAAGWYLAILDRVPTEAWEQPGLGVWTVRELAAHTARAFTTIESYLAAAPTDVAVPDAVAYFTVALADASIHAGVAERGRETAASLGDDLVQAVGVIAERVGGLVAATPADTITGSAAGGMRFADYLTTRVVELTVHTCDLCAALGLDDQPPTAAADATLSLIGQLAATRPRRAEIVRALTGRAPLPVGCNVLG